MAGKNNLYHYIESGLDWVYLVNGYETTYDDDLGEMVSIHDVDGLNKSIMNFIVQKAPCIRGQEVRFIRSFLQLSQTQMGHLAGVDLRTIQRWEKSECYKPIPGPAEQFLRMFVGAILNRDEIANSVCKKLQDIKDSHRAGAKAKCEKFGKIKLSDTSEGWKAAA